MIESLTLAGCMLTLTFEKYRKIYMLGSGRNNLREVFMRGQRSLKNNAETVVITIKAKDHSLAHSSTY